MNVTKTNDCMISFSILTRFAAFLPRASLTARRRGALRLLAELFLCGVISDTATVLAILKSLAKSDKGDDPACPQLALIAGFFRYAGDEFLGAAYRPSPDAVGAKPAVAPTLAASAAAASAAASSSASGSASGSANVGGLVPAATQQQFATFCEQYATALIARLTKRHAAWRALEKEALVARLTKGVAPDAKLAQVRVCVRVFMCMDWNEDWRVGMRSGQSICVNAVCESA
jgi:hypothetical protein